MSALLLLLAVFILCWWLVISGIRDMVRGFGRQRQVTENRTDIRINIENSFNGRVPHGNRETDTFGFDTETDHIKSAFTSNSKRW